MDIRYEIWWRRINGSKKDKVWLPTVVENKKMELKITNIDYG